jgi:glycosidase
VPAAGSLGALGYQAWWGLPALPKLNTSNPHARAYLLSAAEHWIRFGADGWRLDVAEEVPDDFWREFRQRVKAVDPDAYIVAEVWHEKPGDLRGDMYDALMNYPLAEAILSFVAAGRWTGASSTSTSPSQLRSATRTRRPSPRASSARSRHVDGRTSGRAAEPARQPRHAALPLDGRRATRRRCGWRR